MEEGERMSIKRAMATVQTPYEKKKRGQRKVEESVTKTFRGLFTTHLIKIPKTRAKRMKWMC